MSKYRKRTRGVSTNGGVHINVPVTEEQYNRFHEVCVLTSSHDGEFVTPSELLRAAIRKYIKDNVNLYEKRG